MRRPRSEDPHRRERKFCVFCDFESETLDTLVRHLVNEHDELWDPEKHYGDALREAVKIKKR